MTDSHLPSRRNPGRPVRPAVLGLLVAALASALAAPSYGQPVPAAAAPVAEAVLASPSAPAFSAPYLDGVSGAKPARK